jgi:hypothetical protein
VYICKVINNEKTEIMKETALEWFIDQLRQVNPTAYNDMLYYGLCNHALELEKQQIIEEQNKKTRL